MTFISLFMTFIIFFNIFFIGYYTYTQINKKIIVRTIIKLLFQKIFAFFNSINWKAINRNLIAEIANIKKTTRAEIAFEVAIKAVVNVNKIRVR